MSDTKGSYRKFQVLRLDGKSQPGEKHEHCEYFVLDLDHDPHAIAAIRAYAESCEKDRPKLARDLREKAKYFRGRFQSDGLTAILAKRKEEGK